MIATINSVVAIGRRMKGADIGASRVLAVAVCALGASGFGAARSISMRLPFSSRKCPSVTTCSPGFKPRSISTRPSTTWPTATVRDAAVWSASRPRRNRRAARGGTRVARHRDALAPVSTMMPAVDEIARPQLQRACWESSPSA